MTKLKILQVGISRRQTSFLVLLLHQSGEEGKIQHEELLHSTISILKSKELPLCLARCYSYYSCRPTSRS